jgi:DNA-binding transcriptional LysR family regulator
MISAMRDVHLPGLDLNLLPALEALLRTCHVSRAASEVGLSQPAMSRALGRLRALFDDPLLVRGQDGLALTPRALALRASVTQALEQVKGVYRIPQFAPAEAQRIVRIAATDSHTILVAPTLMARLAREAPGLDLRFENYSADMRARLETGGLDFAFALANAPLPPAAASMPIGWDELALVMRRGHKLARKRWTIEDYGRVDHAAISILGDGRSELDALLAAHGVQRRIALVTPHFAATLAAVAATDLVSTVSRAFAARFTDTFDLVLRKPPFKDIEMQLVLVWAQMRSADPLLAWLRGVIADETAAAMRPISR